MSKNNNVHPFCDICGEKLSSADIDKNAEFENYEFPICDKCFQSTVEKVKYVLKNSNSKSNDK